MKPLLLLLICTLILPVSGQEKRDDLEPTPLHPEARGEAREDGPAEDPEPEGKHRAANPNEDLARILKQINERLSAIERRLDQLEARARPSRVRKVPSPKP